MSEEVQVIKPKKPAKRRDRQLHLERAGECLNASVAIMANAAHGGMPAKYPDTKEGFAKFQAATEEWIAMVQATNDKAEDPKDRVIPDVENWCGVLRISRHTLSNYERNYSDGFTDYINMMKTMIASCKKQMSLHGVIPPMFGIFDMVNNHDYKNTSEFKLEVSADMKLKPQRSSIELGERYGLTQEQTEVIVDSKIVE